MIIVFEAAEPLYEPVPDPLQELRTYWVPAAPEKGVVTLKVAVEPELYHPAPEGDP